MSGGDFALVDLADRASGLVAELRREAVVAVVRQQRLCEELGPVRAQAVSIEERASRALRQREDTFARRILHLGMATLKTRDALEEEVAEARRRLSAILKALVRAENRAWNLPAAREPEARAALSRPSRPAPRLPRAIHGAPSRSAPARRDGDGRRG